MLHLIPILVTRWMLYGSMFGPQVGSYHNVLHLVLRSVPRVPVKVEEESCSSCSNLFSPRITTSSKPKLTTGGC